MIKQITWEEILPIWRNKLWENRISPIETNSAMIYLGGYDMNNMSTTPTFFGYILDDKIVGVYSGHLCSDGSYRSRGIWVDPDYRNKGIGKALISESIDQARKEGCSTTWAYPRKSTWPIFKSLGFELASEWSSSETSDANAYVVCIL